WRNGLAACYGFQGAYATCLRPPGMSVGGALRPQGAAYTVRIAGGGGLVKQKTTKARPFVRWPCSGLRLADQVLFPPYAQSEAPEGAPVGSVVLAPVVGLALGRDYVCGVLVAEVEHAAPIIEGRVRRGRVSLTGFETTAAELGGTFDGAGRALDCVRHEKSMGPPLPPRNAKTTRPGRLLSVRRYWRRACAP